MASIVRCWRGSSARHVVYHCCFHDIGRAPDRLKSVIDQTFTGIGQVNRPQGRLLTLMLVLFQSRLAKSNRANFANLQAAIRPSGLQSFSGTHLTPARLAAVRSSLSRVASGSLRRMAS